MSGIFSSDTYSDAATEESEQYMLRVRDLFRLMTEEKTSADEIYAHQQLLVSDLIYKDGEFEGQLKFNSLYIQTILGGLASILLPYELFRDMMRLQNWSNEDKVREYASFFSACVASIKTHSDIRKNPSGYYSQDLAYLRGYLVNFYDSNSINDKMFDGRGMTIGEYMKKDTYLQCLYNGLMPRQYNIYENEDEDEYEYDEIDDRRRQEVHGRRWW